MNDSPTLTILKGNPTSIEIAAIVSAYSAHLASIVDKSVDNSVDSVDLWAKSIRLVRNDDGKNPLLSGKIRDWTKANRIKSRIY